MLDDYASLLSLDSSNLLTRLAALPHSYDGPDGLRKEPYGLIAYGEASSVPQLFKTWLDAEMVLSGTQFLFVGGFDYGDAVPMKFNAELAGAEVIVLGHGLRQLNWEVLPDVLSTYTYAGYLAHATGHKHDWLEANNLMRELAGLLNPEVETSANPAKTLAWNLWNRVPLLLASRRQNGLIPVIQSVMGRVAKSLAIGTTGHPLEVITGAFESRHQLGDDLLGLVLGEKDEEILLAEEVLLTRVAQLERISLPFAGIAAPTLDIGAYNLLIWYISLWVAAYLAILHKADPADSKVYRAAREASQTQGSL